MCQDCSSPRSDVIYEDREICSTCAAKLAQDNDTPIGTPAPENASIDNDQELSEDEVRELVARTRAQVRAELEEREEREERRRRQPRRPHPLPRGVIQAERTVR